MSTSCREVCVCACVQDGARARLYVTDLQCTELNWDGHDDLSSPVF